MRRSQYGAAVLMAILTVAVVASLAAAAIAHQWKAVEVEIAERHRAQAQWLLRGALDWSRLLLRQDAQSQQGNPVDHLSEPWAMPLQKTQLSAFVTAQKGVSDASISTVNAMLSGGMQDMQSKLNLMNLVYNQSEENLKYAQRLFDRLGIDGKELQKIREGLTKSAVLEGNSYLMPIRMDDLKWIGVSDDVIQKIKPYAALMPVLTTVNINTAPAEVIWACIPGSSWSQALNLVNERKTGYFKSVSAALERVGLKNDTDSSQISVASNYFEATGFLELDGVSLAVSSLLVKNGYSVVPLQVNTSSFAAEKNTGTYE